MTVQCVYSFALPGQIIIADQQEVLHQGEEVAFSFGVLHRVDQNVKHFPRISKTNSVKAKCSYSHVKRSICNWIYLHQNCYEK